MARAVVATGYGGPEVLAVVDHDPGPPGPGQVLVDMRAAGVNPADWKSYSGAWGRDATRLPIRVGYELAGVVSAVGPDVGGVDVGDEVIAHPVQGAYADRVLVKASTLVPKPASLDWPQAGALLLAGSTAWHALTVVGVGAGDTVLVHGASGGVGSMAVQLAHIRGARVLGTAGAANHDRVVELGAVPLSYGAGLRRRVEQAAPGGVHAVIDTSGTDEALEVSVEVTKDRHRVVTIAGFARGAQLGVHVFDGSGPDAHAKAEARTRLAHLAGVGRLKVHIGSTYHLADAAKAHRAGIAGSGGKMVLLP